MLITHKNISLLSFMLACSTFSPLVAEKALPEKILSIMQQPKYAHSTWGLYAKDTETGQVLYDLNSEKFFLPASTTKLFSSAALLHAYGDDYRFKTPVYAMGDIKDGKLTGNLVLVAQGDLTMGGRQDTPDTIAFTKMDHIYANTVPGAILTKQDPLQGINALAKQVAQKGIKEIVGDILIDDRLFESTERRGMLLTPIMINENVIDFVVNPMEIGEAANLTWRPAVEGYSVTNKVKTVAKEGKLDIHVTADATGKNMVIEGTIPTDQKEIIRTFALKDPAAFAKAAFIQALKKAGIAIKTSAGAPASLPATTTLQKSQPIAEWVSPPLSEYTKLILKVSHNVGADLIPLLLAAHKGEKTFDAGMLELGNFVTEVVKISPDSFVFLDGAGGDENRLTPQAEVAMLEYMRQQPSAQFQKYFDGLPILGVDGSLEDFAKKTDAVGKARAKPGTGVTFNLATQKFFLTTQTLAGYIEGKNGHLIEYMVGVNNAKLPSIEDVPAIFEDESQITATIYDLSGNE